MTGALLVALLHSTWQGLLAAALAEIAAAGATRPETRGRVAGAALALQVGAFAGTFATNLRTEESVSNGFVALVTDAPSSSIHPVVAVWLAGVTLVGARWIAAFLAVERLRSRSIAAPPALRARFELLKARMGVGQDVALRLVRDGVVPMAVGALRPVVLVPASLLARLPPEQLEALLLHELAHVRRLDFLMNAAQAVAETLLFHHPATWWLSSRIRHERELACDALAAGILEDRLGYARALTGLEELRALAAAPAANGGQLLDRIRRIVGADLPPRRARWPLPALVSGSALALFSAAAVASSAPAEPAPPEEPPTEAPTPDAEEAEEAVEPPAPVEEPAAAPEPSRKARRRAERDAERARRDAERAREDAERAREEALRRAEEARVLALRGLEAGRGDDVRVYYLSARDAADLAARDAEARAAREARRARKDAEVVVVTPGGTLTGCSTVSAGRREVIVCDEGFGGWPAPPPPPEVRVWSDGDQHGYGWSWGVPDEETVRAWEEQARAMSEAWRDQAFPAPDTEEWRAWSESARAWADAWRQGASPGYPFPAPPPVVYPAPPAPSPGTPAPGPANPAPAPEAPTPEAAPGPAPAPQAAPPDRRPRPRLAPVAPGTPI